MGTKETVPTDGLINSISDRLADIQKAIFDRAHAFRALKTQRVQSKDDFYAFYGKGADGFVLAYCSDSEITEKMLKDDLKVTARCIPLETKPIGERIFTGQTEAPLTLFARAY